MHVPTHRNSVMPRLANDSSETDQFLKDGWAIETVRTFGLKYCGVERTRKSVLVPSHDPHGRLLGWESLLSDKSPRNQRVYRRTAGKPFANGEDAFGYFYNAHRVRNSGERPLLNDLILVQAFSDVWWLWQHGYRNVCAALTDGYTLAHGQQLHDLISTDGNIWVVSGSSHRDRRYLGQVFLALGGPWFVRHVIVAQGNHLTNHTPIELASMPWNSS